ncbi:MAG: UV DNA damage repair endonuclease UvsE [Candidatus Lokiarchaeota archaeon]|nr:UV DNA damage repair endonuclease UvsE [Candidatus Lokiarchaeota archaeon]
MKIGYPCINLSIDCRSSRTFRLKNYSEKRVKETIDKNLDCLRTILEFNVAKKMYFFRITSDLIPFASHTIMNFDWQKCFSSKLIEIGEYINENKIRVSMHPGQYTVINSKNQQVYHNSRKELEYHVNLLDSMNLDASAKIITHIGGVYENKVESMRRFIKRYNELSNNTRKRYVIENDDKSYNINDCLSINQETGIPIVFDIYHHECNKTQKTMVEEFQKVTTTWKINDGVPIVHYSSEHPLKGKPRHADEIDILHFSRFLEKTKKFDFDIMLEIKDKERSAIKALKLILDDNRFNNNN